MLSSPLHVVTIAVLLIIVAVGLRAAWSHPRLAVSLDRVLLSLPVVGPLISKSIVARLARTLGTLLRSGVPILRALESCEDIVGSSLFREAVEGVGKQLREGHPMTMPLQRSGLFEPIFLQLTRVGEETGTLDAMLLRTAEYFEVDVESAIATLGSIVEPALIIVLGTIVGTIVASVIIPLYSIIGSIK